MCLLLSVNLALIFTFRSVVFSEEGFLSQLHTTVREPQRPTSLQSDKTREGCFRSGPLEKPFTDYGELSVFCQSAVVVLIPVPGNHQACFTAEDKQTLSVILGSLWVECGRQVVDVSNLRYCSKETRDKGFGKNTCQPEIPLNTKFDNVYFVYLPSIMIVNS